MYADNARSLDVAPVSHNPSLDADVRAISAFTSFADLVGAKGSYRPSIRIDLYGPPAERVARAYDAHMEAIGDPRRSYCYWIGRDGKLHTSDGLPDVALRDLLRRGDSLTAIERVTLRSLLASVPQSPDERLLRRVLIDCDGGADARAAVDKAVLVVQTSASRFFLVAPRGRLRCVVLRNGRIEVLFLGWE